ncbi:MAG: glycerol-3-phosphate 1-O-acyltransferase PlsY [Planctomycetes bacterium]|nr:glycerol-3-phosphate 1-O-acyltransferase PlsY [Planctomycetota bacterium]
MSFLVAYVLFPVVSYLIGSISFGLLVAKIKSVDLRSQGSGNVGATNVLRVLGTKAGGVVFGLDVLKGAVPALALAYIGRAVAPDAPSWKMLGIIYGACAIFGHVYPIFHQLRGGKAVATSCGVFLCLAPLQTLTALAVWAVVLIFWKYVSVASMAAALSFFLMVLALYHQAADLPTAVPEKEFMVITALLVAAVVFYRHRANIKRLRAGTEPKIMTSKADLRTKEAEKKYGKGRLRGAAGRRNRTRSTEALRNLSIKKKEAEQDDRPGESDDNAASDSQQFETAAPLEEVEEISAEAVEPIIDEQNTDAEETRDLPELPELPEAAEDDGEEAKDQTE